MSRSFVIVLISFWVNGDFFGKQNARDLRGADLRHSIKISFIDAAKGTSKKLSIDYPKQCSKCNGNGSKDGTSIEKCNICNGAGKIGQNHGMIQILTTCHSCSGTGSCVKEKCGNCSGKGVIYKTEKLKVTIPAGVDNGMIMKLAGKGMPSQYGAGNGDLLIQIMVEPHSYFYRNGIDIATDVEISYIDAILGTKINVETIYGKVSLKIPPGTQSGNILRIFGKGIKTKSGEGNHLSKINVKIPNKVSSEEKELLKKLKSLQG